MKIIKNHNRSAMAMNLLWFRNKVFLYVTGLIFFSCGFESRENREKTSNIADYVDFVTLGISVKEKKKPTFSLSGDDSFGLLVADSISCNRIDYHWDDSQSGYNPSDENDKPIASVKFIDRDKFTFKLDALRCTLGNNSNITTYTVKTSGVNYTFTSGEVRIYEAVGQNLADIEITQDGDCLNEACTSGSSIGFLLKTFELEDGSEDVGATSFQEEISISFTDGEPLPAFSLKALKYLDYNPNNGQATLAQVWECNIQAPPSVIPTKCSGQNLSNLRLVFISDKSAPPPGDAFLNDDEATEDEIIDAIKHVHGLRLNPIHHVNNLILAGSYASHPSSGSAAQLTEETTLLTNSKHGVAANVLTDIGFYTYRTKYACIYTVGRDPNNNNLENLDDIGVKCKKVVFGAIAAP